MKPSAGQECARRILGQLTKLGKLWVWENGKGIFGKSLVTNFQFQGR